jgi:hypothetical protein
LNTLTKREYQGGKTCCSRIKEENGCHGDYEYGSSKDVKGCLEREMSYVRRGKGLICYNARKLEIK